MHKDSYSRLQFIKTATLAGIGMGLSGSVSNLYANNGGVEKGKIGIIGLDTSHSVAFAKLFNAPDAGDTYGGFKIVAAYPKGSNDIKESVERIPGYINEIKEYGVQICDSIEDLLKKVDVVLLETNDGRIHLEQALAVIKAKKPVFIDKPMTASLKDAISIFETAQRFNVPVFSSSSLRYVDNLQELVQNKSEKILGADTYSPAAIEKTHPDLFWYGIHGVEILYTAMGVGCDTVVRIHTDSTDVVVGTWADGRIGTVRGTRTGTHDYGGTIYTEKRNLVVGKHEGYASMIKVIVEFFRTGISPINPRETLELLAFMEAADESKRKGGASVSVSEMFQRIGKTRK
jgi:hypothetical protein